MRILIALLAALSLTVAPSVDARSTRKAAPAAAELPTQLPDTVHVDMLTELGEIRIALDLKLAPATARNFLRYAIQKRFDGMVFYRVMRLPWGEQPNGLIQAGLRGDPAKVLPAIAHEPTSRTGILHKAGTLSMARMAPGSATADFSILLSDLPSLDADPASTDPEAQAGYAAFGHVVSGMDVVRRIYDAPLSPTEGVGVMKGQMIAQPVKVISVRKSADQPAAAPAP